MDQTIQEFVPFGLIDGSALIVLVEYYGILMRYATIRQQHAHPASLFMVIAVWARPCSSKSSSVIIRPPWTIAPAWSESGGAKVGHGSGGIMLLRAE